MQPENRDDAEEWLIRAHRDLLLASRLMEPPLPLREFAAYHSQQAVRGR